MNTFGNIIGVIEYLDDHSKFLAAQVSTEWRRAVRCNTDGQVFTSNKTFITATLDDTIIKGGTSQIFATNKNDDTLSLYISPDSIRYYNVSSIDKSILIPCRDAATIKRNAHFNLTLLYTRDGVSIYNFIQLSAIKI